MDRHLNSEHHDESFNEYLNLSRMEESGQMARDASNYKSTPNVHPGTALRSPTGADWQNAPPQYNMMKMMQEMMSSNPMLMTNMMMAQFQMMQQMGGMSSVNLSQSFQQTRERGNSSYDAQMKNISGNISTRATPRNIEEMVIPQSKPQVSKTRNFQARRYTRHNSVQLQQNPPLQKTEETLSQRMPTEPPSIKSTAQKKPESEPPKQAYVKKPVPFDDMPIRPMNQPSSQQLNQPSNPKPIKKAPVPFDEMPIKPMPTNPYNDFADKEMRAPIAKARQQNNAYKQSQERPVKGVNKNFEQLLQQKLGSQYYQKPNDAEPTEQVQPRTSNFLKKGTRQFLSSAKYKGNNQKSVDQVQNAPSPAIGKKSLKDENKPKPKAIPKPSMPRQKSPRVNKIIDIEEHSLQKSERKRQKPSPKPNRKIPNNLLASSSSEGQQPTQLIDIGAGVRVKPAQYQIIKQKLTLSSQPIRLEEQRLQKMRSKYQQLLKTLQFERQQQQQQFQQEKQQFEEYKKEELKIIKNEKRIAERQKQAVCVNTNKKEKEELENAKKQWEKQKEDLKKKQNSSRILIEKQKREIEELKRQVANGSIASTTINNASITVMEDTRQNRHLDRSIGKKPVQIKKKQEVQEVQKKEHKSILNTEGKFSQQKFKQKQVRDHSQKSDNSVTAGKNLSSYLPDYQDLKTDRLKKDQKQQQTKVIPRGQPATLLIDNRRQNLHDQIRVGPSNKWQQYASRSSRSSSRQSERSEENQTYQQGLRIQDLNTIKPLSINMVTEQMIQDLFHYYSNDEYQLYQQMISNKSRKIKSERDVDGKIERVYTDGIKQSIFPAGVRKQITPNGYNIIYFRNRDIKQKLTDGTILYYFSEKKVDQITLLDKTNIYRFDNNQVEFHFEDGTIEIRHADGSIKIQKK